MVLGCSGGGSETVRREARRVRNPRVCALKKQTLYVVINESCKPGDHDYVQPARDESGAAKVMLPEMLVGMLLEMATGAESTPKGGLKQLLDVHKKLAKAAERTGQ